MEFVERRSGISLWRQIADQLRIAIGNGEFDEKSRLPGELALAKRFNVNRHTVRSAIASLEQEGVLRVEQGRGTFIQHQERLRYPIGRRTRFSEGLAGQTRARKGFLKEHSTDVASAKICKSLGLEVGACVVRLETVNTADGLPVSRATSWFPADRFSQMAKRYEELGSVTAIFKTYGIMDYVRVSTRISALHAAPFILADMQLSPGAIVLRTEAINADIKGTPIEYSTTHFAADRVELDIDHSQPLDTKGIENELKDEPQD